MTQGKVTSLGMTEIKWVIADLNQTASVKEQRVDGSSVSMDAVRCTLVTGKAGFWAKFLQKGKYWVYEGFFITKKNGALLILPSL